MAKYTVQKGDSIASICRHFGFDCNTSRGMQFLATVLHYNNITHPRQLIGYTLVVPDVLLVHKAPPLAQVPMVKSRRPEATVRMAHGQLSLTVNTALDARKGGGITKITGVRG